MEIKSNIAVITGASSGIGAEFARQLHRRGAAVILIARRKLELETLCNELNAQRPNSAEFIVADLSKRGTDPQILSLDGVCEILKSRSVDILINNAGFGSFGKFENLDLKREEQMVALNLIAPLVLCHALIPQMKNRRSGAILAVSSVAAFQPIPYMATYAATKGFNFMHAMALRNELSEFGIKVVTLCPGPTATEFGGVARVPGHVTGMFRDSVETVVAKAISALEHNRPFVVPGMRSWFMSLLSRLVPKALSTYLTKRTLQSILPDNSE